MKVKCTDVMSIFVNECYHVTLGETYRVTSVISSLCDGTPLTVEFVDDTGDYVRVRLNERTAHGVFELVEE